MTETTSSVRLTVIRAPRPGRSCTGYLDLTSEELIAERFSLPKRRELPECPPDDPPKAPDFGKSIPLALWCGAGIWFGWGFSAIVFFPTVFLSISLPIQIWRQMKFPQKLREHQMKRSEELSKWRARRRDVEELNAQRHQRVVELLKANPISLSELDEERSVRTTKWALGPSGRRALSREMSSYKLRPASRDDVRRSRARGFVTPHEVRLFAALGALLAVEHQVWTPAGYPADLVTIDPRSGQPWVIEVDGSVHRNAGRPEKDREREHTLVQQGIAVIRVGNDEVVRDVDGVAKAIFRVVALQ